MPDDYDWAAERMLHALKSALQSHGLRSKVGLLPAEFFPRHRGGTGIAVGLVAPARERAAQRETAAWVLEQMGCDWVKPCDIGVEAHLAGKLLDPPPVPPVPVTSADSARSAEGAAVTGMKRCCDCLNRFPVTAFNFISKATGRRSSYCKSCERRRCREGKARRTAAARAARLEAV